jgi:TPR repeat protein
MKKMGLFSALIISFCIAAGLYFENYQKDNYQHYQKSCDDKNATGCYHIGVFYDNGMSVVEQNSSKAKEYFEKACEGGEAKGCFKLAFLYDIGKDVEQDYQAAKKYYGKACDLGDEKGCDDYEDLSTKGY